VPFQVGSVFIGFRNRSQYSRINARSDFLVIAHKKIRLHPGEILKDELLLLPSAAGHV